MVMTAQAIITSKIQQKEDTVKDMELLYEELGRSVATTCDETSFPWCRSELASFLSQKEMNEEQEKRCNSLQNKKKTLNAKNKEKIAYKKEKNKIEKEISTLLSRFGATCFEAYVSSSLDEDIVSLVNPIFAKLKRKTKINEKISSDSSIITRIKLARLNSYRKKLLPALQKVGVLLEKEDKLDALTGHNISTLRAEYEKLSLKHEDIEAQLTEVEKVRRLLKEEGEEHFTEEIERLERTILEGKQNETKAAHLLGEELYKNLPNTITSEMIGDDAIHLIDQITLHHRQLEEVDKDIEKLKNEIKIGEISAKITHDRQKVDALIKQISNCQAQIDKITFSIDDKRREIIELKSKGTYESFSEVASPDDFVGGPYAN